jgi:hypothetical protein
MAFPLGSDILGNEVNKTSLRPDLLGNEANEISLRSEISSKVEPATPSYWRAGWV